MRTNLTLATWGRATVQGLHGVRGARREMQAPLQPGFRKRRVAPVMYITMKSRPFRHHRILPSLMVLVSNPILL